MAEIITTTQRAALETLAAEAGMRVLVTRTQVGVGYGGQMAFQVVWTPGARAGRRWQTRHQDDLPLARRVREIVGG